MAIWFPPILSILLLVYQPLWNHAFRNAKNHLHIIFLREWMVFNRFFQYSFFPLISLPLMHTDRLTCMYALHINIAVSFLSVCLYTNLLLIVFLVHLDVCCTSILKSPFLFLATVFQACSLFHHKFSQSSSHVRSSYPQIQTSVIIVSFF